MYIKENILLSTLTTLRVGGCARYVVECFSIEDIKKAGALARREHIPLIPLGQGSNILAKDTAILAVVALIKVPGINWNEEGSDVFVRVGAGVGWDVLVGEACMKGLWGLENLAGIPGTVGASPVQNIGAYGSDVSESITTVDVLDIETFKAQTLSWEECKFSYRNSTFKEKGNFIITSVNFRLSKKRQPKTDYPDLVRYRESGGRLDTPSEIANAVRDIRSKKFPDLSIWGTAGSFFKNPIISPKEYLVLKKTHSELPGFPEENGIKVPLAWILDHVLELRGFTIGPVSLYQDQPLVLITRSGTRSTDVEVLAKEVERRVREATGITISREVRNL